MGSAWTHCGRGPSRYWLRAELRVSPAEIQLYERWPKLRGWQKNITQFPHTLSLPKRDNHKAAEPIFSAAVDGESEAALRAPRCPLPHFFAQTR